MTAALLALTMPAMARMVGLAVDGLDSPPTGSPSGTASASSRSSPCNSPPSAGSSSPNAVPPDRLAHRTPSHRSQEARTRKCY
ncbi:hypothetical protein NKG94_15625 [Micromonospora sp. M12]